MKETAMDRRQFQARTFALLGAAAAPWAARAQSRPAGPGGFPSKTVKLIVPYPAGGIVDVVMRAATDPLSAELPQRIVVENRTGADGRIGLTAVAQSPADGYTLLAATPIVAVGEHLMADMAGRSKDFAGICAIAAPPSVFVVWSGLPAKTLAEFIALAAAKPGNYNVANPGSGSSIHLGQELLFERTGIKLTNINYRGQPASLIDMAEGRVHFGLISQSLALPLIQTGKLRALAVNAGQRTRSLPDVPTVAEAGHAEALVQGWYGVAAPAKTPPEIVRYLSEQYLQTLAQPASRAKLEAIDAEILALGAAAFDKLIASENLRWGELIRKRGIKMG
jgi:tripartite-type tricarboxylate transporter receptor subunit TctC